MVEVNGISKHYGDKTALNNVSFSIGSGEILGLLGRNGAGKTTAMNIITGYMAPDGGSVSVGGCDMTTNPLEAKRHIGYLPEQPPLYHEMTVWDYLFFACRLKGMRKKDISTHLEEVLCKVNIDDVKRRVIGNLSKGYKQRVGLAQALCGDADVIILDEPTAGMDPAQIIEITQIIAKLGEDHTVIFSSHILKEISDVCTHIIILSGGEKVADSSLHDLLNISEGEKRYRVRLSGSDDFSSEFERIGSVSHVRRLDVSEVGCSDYEITSSAEADVRADIFYSVVSAGRELLMIKPNEMALDTIFTHLTD